MAICPIMAMCPVVSCGVCYLWPLSWKAFLGTFSISKSFSLRTPEGGEGLNDGNTVLALTPRPVPRKAFAGGPDEI